jgi:hypothetical protein
MNYYTLLARLLLFAYGVFLLLIALGEGITEGGYPHIFPPLFILIIVTTFWNRPIISALAVFIVFLATTLYFKTYDEISVFLIISLPLAIASILFLLGSKLKAL